MTHDEQAVLIWPVLCLAARMHRALTYKEIEELTGVIAVSAGNPLFRINRLCAERGYPRLNIIAVETHSGLPGKGEPDGMPVEEALIERMKVFGYDWSQTIKPRVADFASIKP